MNTQYTPEQIAKAVAHKFKGGTVATVTNNEVVVRIGKSFTRIPLRELKQAVRNSEHIDTTPRLSDETLAQIHEEKWGKPKEPIERPSTPSAEQLHRQDVAKKYGI